MADAEDTLEFGVKMNWEGFKDDTLKALRDYAAKLSEAMIKSGANAEQAFSKVCSSLQKLREEGRITEQQFQKAFYDQIDANPNLDKWQKAAFKLGAWLSPSKGQQDFNKSWDRAAMSVVRFRATLWELEKPFKMVYNFTDQLRRLNIQFGNVAQNAGLTASSLAAQSGVFSALGGSAGEYANFRNSFLMEMEKRRIGLGNGGKFTQTMMHYGIRYNPNDPDGTLRSIASFMSSASRSESQKLMVGQMLGLSPAMQNALRRGPDFIDRYERDMKGRTRNKTAATREAEELSLETEKLKASFGDLKDLIFTDLAPAVKLVVTPLADAIEWIKKAPPELRRTIEAGVALGAAFVLVGGAIKTWVAFKGMAGAMLSLGLGGVGGAASKTAIEAATKTATEAATKAATDAATKAAGGAMGGVGNMAGLVGKANPVGVVATVVDAIAGGIQRQIQIHSLSILERVVNQWHKEWSAFVTGLGGGTTDQRLGKFASDNDVNVSFLRSSIRLRKVFANLTKSLREDMPITGHGGQAGAAGVSIARMTITINSSAMDPKALATEIEAVMVKNCRDITYRPGGGRR